MTQTSAPTRTRNVTAVKGERALMIDGKFTPVGKWADLDLDALNWKCPEPEWFADAVSEMRWSNESGERRTAVMLGTSALIRHPYALTLRDTIDDLGADWEYDSFLEAFRVSEPENYRDGLRDICRRYHVAASPFFEDYIDGLDQAVAVTSHNAEEALAQGFQIPTEFPSKRKLKEHQEVAVLSLAASGGGLLADQVGLGKGGEFVCGLVCLNDHLARNDRPASLPAVIAVTKSMKLEIATEVSKWMSGVRIEVLDGTKAAPIDPDVDIVILNHDILNARLDDLVAIKPKAFIADEAHVYKNADSKRTQAAAKLSRAVRKNTADPYIVMASGTPFLNAPKELWALLVVLGISDAIGKVAIDAYREEHGNTMMRTRIGREGNRFAKGGNNSGTGKIRWAEKEIWPQRAFEVRYCGGAYDKYGAWWNTKATHTAELNRLLLDTGMVRRRKSDVIHPLPPLTENLFRFELDDDAAARYQEISEQFRDWLIEEVAAEARRGHRNVERAVEAAVAKLMRGEDVMRLTKLRAELSLMKVPHTVEWVHRFMNGEMGDDEWDGSRRKLILYVHHKEARQALLDEPSFAKYNPVHILPGIDQKDESIVEHKERFQADDDVRLIICTMAAREGHTLTAAKDVYLHEMPFVPSWIVQMAGRCWARLSEEFEPHEAYLHYAIAEDTIDAMLVRMNAVKKSMFSAVIDGEGQDDSKDDLLGEPEKEIGESWQEARDRQGARLLQAFSIGAKELGIAK